MDHYSVLWIYYTGTNGSGTQYISASGYLTSSASTTNFSASGTLYAYWIPRLYIGTTPVKTLDLDGAILLSAVSAGTPSVTANSSYTWQSSNSNIADVTTGGIVKCNTNTSADLGDTTAVITCKNSTGAIVGQVTVTSTSKIVDTPTNTETASIDSNRTISGSAAYNNPTIPYGYQAIDTGIGLTDETGTGTINATWGTGENQSNVNKGLVIMDERGNQFVWVPVPNVIGTPASTSGVNLATNSSTSTPMARTLSGSDYQGNLYKFSGTTSTYQSGYTATGVNGEPSYISGTDYDGNTTYANLFTPTSLQEEYNSMVASVDSYKGFWMARYEGSWDDSQNNIASIAGARSLNTYQANTHIWYGFYSALKNYATGKTSYYTSTMPWGSQYDAMFNWMAKNGITVGSSTPMTGTARNTSNITGIPTYNDKLKNVVDLYGSNREYTLERESQYRVTRGGTGGNNYAPSNRLGSYPNAVNSGSVVCSRPTLYLKEQNIQFNVQYTDYSNNLQTIEYEVAKGTTWEEWID